MSPTSTTYRSSGQNFVGLDALRGVAAILVALVHMRSELLGYRGYPAGDGYLAVDLFYALSGFVLVNAYQGRFEQGMSAAEFLKARIIRLYPLYLLGLLVGAAVKGGSLIGHASAGDGWHLGIAFLFNLFLLPSPRFVGDQLFTLNPVAWSLFFELVLNILLALCWRRISVKSLAGMLALTGVVVATAAVHWGKLSFGGFWHDILFGLARSIFSFSVGIALYGAYRQGRLPSGLTHWPLTLGLVGMAIYLSWPVSAGVRAAYDLLFVAVWSPLLLIAGVACAVPVKLRRTYQVIGAASYALYAVHYPLLRPLADWIQTRWDGHWTPFEFWIGVAVTAGFLGAGYALDRHVDGPLRRWLLQKHRPMAQPQPA